MTGHSTDNAHMQQEIAATVSNTETETELTKLREKLHELHSEIDCRIEHGAEGSAHLEFVRGFIANLLK